MLVVSLSHLPLLPNRQHKYALSDEKIAKLCLDTADAVAAD